jgi:hypothetical protein
MIEGAALTSSTRSIGNWKSVQGMDSDATEFLEEIGRRLI